MFFVSLVTVGSLLCTCRDAGEVSADEKQRLRLEKLAAWRKQQSESQGKSNAEAASAPVPEATAAPSQAWYDLT